MVLRPTALLPALLLALPPAACRFDPSGFPGDARGPDARIVDAATSITCASFCDTCDPSTRLCVVDCSDNLWSTGVDVSCPTPARHRAAAPAPASSS